MSTQLGRTFRRETHTGKLEVWRGAKRVRKHASHFQSPPAATLRIHNRPRMSPLGLGDVSAASRANSKLCRVQHPTRRCTLMSRGHGRSLRCAAQLSSMMGHGESGTSGTGGRPSHPPLLLLLHRRDFPLISSWSCLPCLSASIPPTRD